MEQQVHEGSNGFKVVSGAQLKKWRTPEERQKMAASGTGFVGSQEAARKFEPGSVADAAHGQPAGAQNNLLFHQWKKDGE